MPESPKPPAPPAQKFTERNAESRKRLLAEAGAATVRVAAQDHKPQRAVFALDPNPRFITRKNRTTGTDEELLEVSFSSEAPVRNWWGDLEILSHDPEDCDFSRLANVGSVLRNHDPDQIVGVPEEVWLDDKTLKGRARMRFGDTQCALDCKREVETGILRGVSVGYTVDAWVLLQDEDVSYKGRVKGPAWVAAQWQAIEFSLTPIPADPSVGINRSIELEVTRMDPKEKDARAELAKKEAAAASGGASGSGGSGAGAPAAASPAPAPVVAPVDAERTAETVLARERERVRQIRRMGGTFGIEADTIEDAVEGGTSVEQFRQKVLDAEAKRRQPVGAQVVQDGRLSFARAVCEGLGLRAGIVKRDQLKHDGHVFAGRSLVEIARECLTRAGLKATFSDMRTLVGEALRGPRINTETVEAFARGETIGAGTSDFPFILAVTANKQLLDGFRLAPTTYQSWCKVGNLMDFKASKRIKLTEAGELELIPEQGNYPNAKFGEKQESIQLATYGKKFTISRQAIINDDLEAFTTIPARMGRAAARKPNSLAVTVLCANAVLSDSVALFADGHANYGADVGRVLSDLTKARAMFMYMEQLLRKQKAYIADEEGATVYLGLEPKIWLVPATGASYARMVVVSTADVSGGNAGVDNPFRGMAQVVVEPNLENSTVTGNSSTATYLFADPADAPVIEVAFLQGNREPYMEEVDQNDADGRVIKVRMDCAAAAVDYAGAVKEKGAGV